MAEVHHVVMRRQTGGDGLRRWAWSCTGCAEHRPFNRELGPTVAAARTHADSSGGWVSWEPGVPRG